MTTSTMEKPEIPHMTFNMTPLGVLLERTAYDTFKRLKENLHYLENIKESSNTNSKRQFLDLLVETRERFVKLYVLCKWSRNHEAIGRLVDIFAWLREQNQLISNSLMQFGELKGSLIAAKMLEPDLNTAMEVFSNGRPDLPTYNYLEKEKLTPEFVLKVIKNLNVELSIKMALQMDLPLQFMKYDISDGCINFDIKNHFQCSISMLKNEQFNLIDFKFGFKLINNVIISAVEYLEPIKLNNLQLICNKKLENNNLKGLFDFLFDYSSTFKLQLISKQLQHLKQSLWRGQISYTYDSELKIIKIFYWIQKKFSKPSYIEIGLFDNNKLGFKWFKNSELKEVNDFTIQNEDGSIDLSRLIDELIKRHIEFDIQRIQSNLTDSIKHMDRALSILPTKDKLQFRITQNRDVIYGIDKLSGASYFENPTALMNKIGFKINSSDSIDFIELLNLKLEFQTNNINNMMKATGWMPIKNINLSRDEYQKLNIDYYDLKGDTNKYNELLTKISVYKRKEWQNGWFLLIGTFGWRSTLQLWCGKIECNQGIWKFDWIDEINFYNETVSSETGNENQQMKINLDSISFDDLIELVKLSSSKLISNLVVSEFENQGCKLKILNLSDERVYKFLNLNFGIDLKHQNNTGKDMDNAIALIKNDTWFNIPNCMDSLVLIITVKNSTLKAKLFGKFSKSHFLPEINYEKDEITLNYDCKTNMFKIDTNIDLSKKLNLASQNEIEETKHDFLLSNLSDVLEKFSRILNLIEMIDKDKGLNIKFAQLDCLGFSYGKDKDEWIKLKLNQGDRGINIELSDTNPHKLCLTYLNSLINKGNSLLQGNDFNFMLIKQLVIYLKLTLKFYKQYQMMSDEQNERMRKMIDLNKKPSDLNGYVLNLNGLESLRISYYTNEDSVKLDLSVDIRHRLRTMNLNESLFIISMIELKCENDTLKATIKNDIASVFKGEKVNIQLDEGGRILALGDSLCCDFKNVDKVIDFVHRRICSLLKIQQ